MKATEKDIMKKVVNLFALGLFALISACSDPFSNETFTAYDQVPGATYLRENQEKYGLWSELIDHAGLYNTLNLDRDYTFFVPNNQAVEAYLANHELSSVTDIEQEIAVQLVKYHLLAGTVFDQSQFQNGALPVATQSDDDLTIAFKEGGLSAIYLNDEARFVTLDIHVTNGIIHEIEAVLEPVTESIYEVLSVERYDLFRQILEVTGYAEAMALIYEVDTLEGQVINKRFQYTVFVVSDSIYNADGISSLVDLNTRLGTTGTNYTAKENALHQYISYHILGTLRSSDALVNFPDGASAANINPLAENQIISVTLKESAVQLNYDENASVGVGILASNIPSRNGVIHEVDDWMPVFSPAPVTVLWDFADQSDIAILCSKYQRGDLSGSYYNRSFLPAELTSYTWKSVPEDEEGVVAYRNNRNADGIYYFTHNYDHIRVTTGPSGYVDITTPVIIQGAYKVTIQYVSPRNSADHSMLVSLDGQQLGGVFSTTNDQQDKLASRVLAESFTFDKTQSHTFRVVGIDGKILALDYLLFEPIQ